jgi:DNA-directed RNA polymerase specialized sigma24 family protein
VLDEAALAGPAGSSETPVGIEAAVDGEPTPQLAAQVAEEYERLLDLLGDDELRTVALWKMEGYNEEEIAVKLGCVPRSVRRKLRRIRTLWAMELEP